MIAACPRRRRCRSSSCGRRRCRSKIYLDTCLSPIGFIGAPFAAAGFGYVAPLPYPPGVAGYPVPPPGYPVPYANPVAQQPYPIAAGYPPQYAQQPTGQAYYGSHPSSPITVPGGPGIYQCYAQHQAPLPPPPPPPPPAQPQQCCYIQQPAPCSMIIGPPPSSCSMGMLQPSLCSMTVDDLPPPPPAPARSMRSSKYDLSSSMQQQHHQQQQPTSSKYDLDRQFSYISQAPTYQCQEVSRPISPPYYTRQHHTTHRHHVTTHRSKVYPNNPFPNHQRGLVC